MHKRAKLNFAGKRGLLPLQESPNAHGERSSGGTPKALVVKEREGDIISIPMRGERERPTSISTMQ